MIPNPIVEMQAFHHTYQDQRGGGKPLWRTDVTVTFMRADGRDRTYGCRTLEIFDDEVIATPPLSERQWRRLKRVYDRLRRHVAWTAKTDYRPPAREMNYRPYYELHLKRRQR
jgi:hypothetical protein